MKKFQGFSKTHTTFSNHLFPKPSINKHEMKLFSQKTKGCDASELDHQTNKIENTKTYKE